MRITAFHFFCTREYGSGARLNSPAAQISALIKRSEKSRQSASSQIDFYVYIIDTVMIVKQKRLGRKDATNRFSSVMVINKKYQFMYLLKFKGQCQRKNDHPLSCHCADVGMQAFHFNIGDSFYGGFQH